jgi:multisubunit Na+/H+ antiporter MnhE subunit
MVAAVAWVGLAALYLLFAGQVSRNEIIAGLGASVLAALYAAVARHVAKAKLRLRLHWPRIAASVLRSLVVDTAKVGVALLRCEPGLLTSREQPAQDAGQRAVTVLAVSVAPNSFVVRDDGDALVLHELVRAPR